MFPKHQIYMYSVYYCSNKPTICNSPTKDPTSFLFIRHRSWAEVDQLRSLPKDWAPIHAPVRRWLPSWRWSPIYLGSTPASTWSCHTPKGGVYLFELTKRKTEECSFLSHSFAKDEDTIRNTCEVYSNYLVYNNNSS